MLSISFKWNWKLGEKRSHSIHDTSNVQFFHQSPNIIPKYRLSNASNTLSRQMCRKKKKRQSMIAPQRNSNRPSARYVARAKQYRLWARSSMETEWNGTCCSLRVHPRRHPREIGFFFRAVRLPEPAATLDAFLVFVDASPIWILTGILHPHDTQTRYATGQPCPSSRGTRRTMDGLWDGKARSWIRVWPLGYVLMSFKLVFFDGQCYLAGGCFSHTMGRALRRVRKLR